MNINKNFLLMNYYRLRSSFHTSCQSHNWYDDNNLISLLDHVWLQNYLDKFVEKHVEIVSSGFKEDISLYITMPQAMDIPIPQIKDITMSQAKDLARDMIRNAIKSGEMKPYDEDEIDEILELIPEGLLDDEVNDGISELLNDPTCQEELSEFNSRKELEEYILRFILKEYLSLTFSGESHSII